MRKREEPAPIVCSEEKARHLMADVSARTVRRLGESGAIRTGKLSGRRVYVVESIQYATTVVLPMVGMNPPVVRYSALVWLTRAIKI